MHQQQLATSSAQPTRSCCGFYVCAGPTAFFSPACKEPLFSAMLLLVLQGAGAQRSSKPLKQQQRPAGRKLQLGEEDSYGAAAEHYRPPVFDTPAAADGTACTEAAGADDPGSCCDSSRSCRPGDGSSNSSCCHLPSLQQGHQQQHGDTTAAVAAGFLHQGLQQAAGGQQACTTAAAAVSRISNSTDSGQLGDGDDLGDALGSSLYAPRGNSRGTGGLLMPSTASRSLLPSNSSNSSSNPLNSNILALQQLLLLPRPGAGLPGGSAAGSSSMSSSSTGPTVTAGQSAARPLSGSHRQGLQVRGPGLAGQQAAVPGLALHARMASTAARAQLLLCRELTSMVPPPAPRARPAAAVSTSAAGATAGAGLRPTAGQQQQQQQLDDFEAGGSSLRFVSSTSMMRPTGSRPSSAARGTNSSSGLAGSVAASAAPCTVGLNPQGPYSPHSSSTSRTNYLQGSSSNHTAVGAAAAGHGTSTTGRRPVSATVGGVSRWGSSSGSEGGSSGRPSTSGSGFGSFTAGAAHITGALAQPLGARRHLVRAAERLSQLLPALPALPETYLASRSLLLYFLFLP